MLTSAIRANARYNIGWGIACIIAAAVLSLGAYVNLDLLTTWFEGVGYIGTALFIVLGLLLAAVILIGHGLRTLADCEKIDANTRSYDPNTVYGGAGYSGPTTGAIHYDGNVPDSVQVSVDGVRYEMDTKTGELK